MSGVFKAIGKVFKGVVKVVKKVALPALMIGAVVLTGGAAIGALPALGSILGAGGLGLSAGLASALGGAISAGAIGAATGGLSAAIQGKNILKGATGGFLTGAVTGGLMGAAGMVSPNGILSDFGVGSAASAKAGLAATQGLGNAAATGAKVAADLGSKVIDAAGKTIPSALGSVNSPIVAGGEFMPGLTGGPVAMPGATQIAEASKTGLLGLSSASAPLTSVAPPAVQASAPSPLQQALFGQGGNLTTSLLGNQGLLGSVLGGIGQGMSEGEAAQAAQERDDAQRRYYTENYGVDPGTGQLRSGSLLGNYAQTGPLNFSTPAATDTTFQSPGHFAYDPTTRRVRFIPAGAG